MQSLPYVLEVGSQEVILTPDPAHEFTATTEQVALGYGVSPSTIRDHKANRPEELVEGKHWVVGVIDTLGGRQQVTFWTKRGIVRLGFFIRSARARMFRDMAEDLVIGHLTAAQGPHASALISAENIGKVTGQTRNAVLNYLRRMPVPPVAVGFKKQQQGTYLYELVAVLAGYEQKGWTFDPDTQFEVYTGRVNHDLSAVRTTKRHGVPTRTAPQHQHQPRLLPTDTSTEQLARRLLSLEAQKRAVLKELAALA
ncbi:hypothetical protein CTI14_06845 [Methylobacterium radiotolerans]|nr:hypothetical protein CTI14_06845 [Methylobacterium radiotolerans]